MEEYKAFVQSTIDKQVEIVYKVRDIQNYNYILFDKNFKCHTIDMVGNFRVEVDESGRRAILSTGAQINFNSSLYYPFVKHYPGVVLQNEVVMLCKK